MTPTELRAAYKELGLTQAQLAARLEISERTIRRYVKGDWPIPKGVEYAIKWLKHLGPSD